MATKRLTAAQKSATGMALAAKGVTNLRNAGVVARDGQQVPYPAINNWGGWIDAMATLNLLNPWMDNVLDNIFLQFATKPYFDNRLKKFYKGLITNGAGIKQIYIDKMDAYPFEIGGDAAKEELKTYLSDVYEARYILNFTAQYRRTLGRNMFRSYLSSPEGVIDFIEALKAMMYTSKEIDEFDLTILNLTRPIVNGMCYIEPVDMSDGLVKMSDFATRYRKISFDLASETSRQYNQLGVTAITPREKQVLFITSEYAAQYETEELASAFNIAYKDFNTRVEVLKSFNRDAKAIEKLHNACANVPLPLDGEKDVLDNVVAILIDEDLLQIYNYIDEMWEKERASRTDINYFLSVEKGFNISPFANMVVFVKSSAVTEQPASIEYEIVAKSIANGWATMSLVKKDGTASLVGGGMNLTGSDNEDALVFKNGVVKMALADTNGATLEGMIRDVEYKSAEALLPTANVGDTVTFNKVE